MSWITIKKTEISAQYKFLKLVYIGVSEVYVLYREVFRARWSYTARNMPSMRARRDLASGK